MQIEMGEADLEKVWDGSFSLSSLIGKKYEGSFGPYSIAGLITSVRRQNDQLFINFQLDAPFISYTRHVGVGFIMPHGPKLMASRFFIGS